jgi:hypothetical protein
VAWITHYYSTYHSIRQVHDKLVIRLEKELSAENIAQLNESFADLIESGKIEKTEARRQEQDEPQLMSKPRISFRNNKQSPGRLNEMILAINEMGSGK